MRIISKIQAAKVSYEIATSVMPTKLYLGETEYAELERCAKEIADFVIKDPLYMEEKRAEIMGLKLFKVDAKSHFYVG